MCTCRLQVSQQEELGGDFLRRSAQRRVGGGQGRPHEEWHRARVRATTGVAVEQEEQEEEEWGLTPTSYIAPT